MANIITPLSAEDQLTLRNKAKAELERLEGTLADEKLKKKIDDFKDKFSVCEIVYKVVLEDHQFNKYGVHKDRLQVSMKEAPYALTYAGYDFDRNLLSNLFSGEDHIGKRSVKKLRDALTHSVSKSAVEELEKRESELYGYMDSFLEKIRVFDATTAA